MTFSSLSLKTLGIHTIDLMKRWTLKYDDDNVGGGGTQ